MGEKQRQREREGDRIKKHNQKGKERKIERSFMFPISFQGFNIYINMSTIVNYSLIKTVTQRLARIAIFRGAFFGVDHQAALEFELHPDAAPDESSCGGRWNLWNRPMEIDVLVNKSHIL